MKKTAMKIIDTILNSKSVLICGHLRPDGDCIGSALAMRRICEKLGIFADAVCEGEKPTTFEYLKDYELFCSPRKNDYDLFIAVDCADEKRLGEYRRYLNSARKSINIDHHPNNGYADINVIEPDSSSTCALIFELFKDSDLIDKEIAAMLYTGLSTDTGHFMHANTDYKVFKIASKLCEYGIDVGTINRCIYKNKSANKIALTALALNNMRYYVSGKIALMTITLDDLEKCGCDTTDTEGLIDYASSVSGVKISLCMCEQPGNLFRISLRSVDADVSVVAARFGGGGHKLAAGCIINGNRYDVAEKIVKAASLSL